MIKQILPLLMFSMTTVALGHDGGSGHPGIEKDGHKKSAVEIAYEHYSKGEEFLNVALSMEEQSKSSTSAKEKTKYRKRAIKQYKKAAKQYGRAVKNDPLLYQAYTKLGFARSRSGDHDGALRWYDQALQLQPRDAETIAYRAQSYLAIGRLKDSQAAYTQLVKIDRGKATELMIEMRRWAAALPDGESTPNEEEVVAFSQWMAEQRNSP